MALHKTTLLPAVFLAAAVVIMARPSVQRTVQVTNQLSGRALIVHCGSKDDDLRAHVVEIGAAVGWSFAPNAFGGTLFWCNLAVEDKRLSFVAYEEGRDMLNLDRWVVHDDGVYGDIVGRKYCMFAWRQI